VFSYSIFVRKLNKIFRSKIEIIVEKENLSICLCFRETEKVDREALYCSSALHKIRQNAFYERLHDHQMRWV